MWPKKCVCEGGVLVQFQEGVYLLLGKFLMRFIHCFRWQVFTSGGGKSAAELPVELTFLSTRHQKKNPIKTKDAMFPTRNNMSIAAY